MFRAEQVGNPANGFRRTPKVLEFSGAVQRRAVENYVVVNVRPIYVRSHNEGMAAFRKRKGELPPDLVGFYGGLSSRDF